VNCYYHYASTRQIPGAPAHYNWKSKYGGMEASDIKRLKELEDENRRLKQMYAELSLDYKILKDIVEKSCKASCSKKLGQC